MFPWTSWIHRPALSSNFVLINSLTDTAPLRHRCITIEEGLVTATAARQRQTSVNRQPPPTHHQSPRDPARRDDTRPLVRQNRVGATTNAITRKMKILVTRSENSFLNSGELLIPFSLLVLSAWDLTPLPLPPAADQIVLIVPSVRRSSRPRREICIVPTSKY